MGLSLAFAFLAAAAPGGSAASPTHVPVKAVVAAKATVRILSGARVKLSDLNEADGHRLNPATITAEDGSKRPAQLVEFQ